MFRKRYSKLTVLLLAVITLSVVFLPGQVEAKQPKHVIFLIGDGMGNAHATLTEYYMQDKLNDKDYKLNLHKLDETAVTTTYGADTLVPGSAQTATALASGVLTNRNYVGVNTNKEEVTTVMERAEANGWGTGLVSTARITHATPAAFASHVPHRDMENTIIEHYLKNNIDVVMGGGYRHLVPKSNPVSRREDNKDMFEEFAKAGYNVFEGSEDLTEFREFKPEGEEKLLASFTPSHMSYELDRDKDEEPSIAEMTQKSIEILDKRERFFLMVEGGRIDHAAHANDPAGVVHDTLAFDKAVKAAYDFYKKHPENTLIIVGADHETGGLGLNSSEGLEYEYYVSLDELTKQKATIEGGINYTGNKEALYENLATNFGLKDLTKKEKNMLEKAIKIQDEKGSSAAVQNYWPQATWISPVQATVAHIVSERAHLGWNTSAHTGSVVKMAAHGVGADAYNGVIDNTDVGNITADVLGFTLNGEKLAPKKKNKNKGFFGNLFGAK